jgi:hypothetical protein
MLLVAEQLEVWVAVVAPGDIDPNSRNNGIMGV